ncbi:MAG: ABC transporter substrate-binding protein [Erysipelotrichaceae bacterium]|nr:ABC transporter substrate-binding protein [Erysipelotrichaceae bacterium]
MKKLFALLLALLLLVGCSNGGGSNNEGGEQPSGNEAVTNQIIYGSTTELNGDLGNAWWGNNASDATVRELIDDYSVITTDQGGELVENQSVTTGVTSVENEDGTKTFTVGIKDGLKYNNGEPITAADYVAYALVAYSPALKEAGGKVTANSVKGALEYQNGEVNYISGIRLLDDHTYSITINKDDPTDPDTHFLPYYFDATYASLSPLYLPMYASAALTVKDDGEGVYLDGGSLVASELDASRTIYEGRVSAGPYQLESLDLGSLTATLTINPNYAGNFEGQKPSVEKILIVKAVQETMMDQLETGAIDFLSALTDGSEVQRALDMEDTGNFKTVHYERNGYGAIFFQCDFGPTQFPEVRHAVAYLLDRNEFANTFCQGFGSVVDGPYGLAMWMYKDSKDTLASTLNSYTYSVESAVEELKAGGWTLNADGTDYVDGSGLVRYKEVTPEEAGDYAYNVTLADGRVLMPLHIEWSSSEGNSVSELLAVMLANGDQTKEAGMEINQNIMSFADLLNYYYRDSSVDPKYGVKTYGMYNLATNFTALYDQSYSYTVDPELLAMGYNTFFSVDNPLLDQLSMDMVYGVEAGDDKAYLDTWVAFIQEWNRYLPAVPLYSNVYYDAMNAKINNLECNSLFDFQKAVVYATVD